MTRSSSGDICLCFNKPEGLKLFCQKPYEQTINPIEEGTLIFIPNKEIFFVKFYFKFLQEFQVLFFNRFFDMKFFLIQYVLVFWSKLRLCIGNKGFNQILLCDELHPSFMYTAPWLLITSQIELWEAPIMQVLLVISGMLILKSGGHNYFLITPHSTTWNPRLLNFSMTGSGIPVELGVSEIA
jgi:hypothetical protein